jgi:hypothetical protein
VIKLFLTDNDAGVYIIIRMQDTMEESGKKKEKGE